MGIRHVVEATNVDEEGFVVDATAARHCTIRAGAVFDLAGDVDPLTHLNWDFPDHALGECVVAEHLQLGARVHTDADGRFMRARTRPEAMARLGLVNLDARHAAWLKACSRRDRAAHADARR
jgi:hypothetical protein